MQSMNSNQENLQANAIKNVQRIRLKKKSEANIAPIMTSSSKIPDLILAKQQKSNPSPIFQSNFHKEEEPNDWRISVIEPNSGA